MPNSKDYNYLISSKLSCSKFTEGRYNRYAYSRAFLDCFEVQSQKIEISNLMRI